jgi:hypothetical protein
MQWSRRRKQTAKKRKHHRKWLATVVVAILERFLSGRNTFENLKMRLHSGVVCESVHAAFRQDVIAIVSKKYMENVELCIGRKNLFLPHKDAFAKTPPVFEQLSAGAMGRRDAPQTTSTEIWQVCFCVT